MNPHKVSFASASSPGMIGVGGFHLPGLLTRGKVTNATYTRLAASMGGSTGQLRLDTSRPPPPTYFDVNAGRAAQSNVGGGGRLESSSQGVSHSDGNQPTVPVQASAGGSGGGGGDGDPGDSGSGGDGDRKDDSRRSERNSTNILDFEPEDGPGQPEYHSSYSSARRCKETKLPTFPLWDGKEWDEYLLEAGTFADTLNWTDNIMLEQLRLGVRRHASLVVQQTRGSSLQDFIFRMNETFCEKTPRMREKEFLNLRQTPCQTPKMFVNEIGKKGSAAFGRWDSTLNRMAMNVFYQGLLDQGMAEFISLKNPQNLSEATRLANLWRDRSTGGTGTFSSYLGASASEPEVVKSPKRANRKKGKSGKLSAMVTCEPSDDCLTESEEPQEDEMVAEFNAFRNWRTQQQGTSRFGSGGSGGFPRFPGKPKDSEERPKILCNLCGEEGHKAWSCPRQKETIETIRLLKEKLLDKKPGNPGGSQ